MFPGCSKRLRDSAVISADSPPLASLDEWHERAMEIRTPTADSAHASRQRSLAKTVRRQALSLVSHKRRDSRSAAWNDIEECQNRTGSGLGKTGKRLDGRQKNPQRQ